jgi:uncharacterized protein (TIGR00106 family)
MAIAEVTVIPIGTATTSLSPYVADMQKALGRCEAEYGIHFEMTAMSTIIEGNLDQVLAVIRVIHELPFSSGAGRVSTSIKIDDRRDQPSSITQKLNSVASRMKS